MLLIDIKSRLVKARQEHNKIERSILSTLVGEIENELKLSKSTEQEIVSSKIKSFLKSTEQMSQYNDVSEETTILKSLLPAQLNETQIIEVFETNNLKTVRDRMAFLKTNYAGQYDGKLASKIAKEM